MSSLNAVSRVLKSHLWLALTRISLLLLGGAAGCLFTDEFARAQAQSQNTPTIDRAAGTQPSPAPPLNTSPVGTATASSATRGPQGSLSNAATVQTLQTATSAGRTAGQFAVTPTGAASYNIPIWTPPGAREIEPHLALHYTSGGPDGPMGPGWSLTGLSAISRCGSTWASSGGNPKGVSLVTSDDLCLDGNRLRLTSGTQGVANSTYQTEIADFSNVTAYGATGNGPAYFIVQGKDGRYYEYGNTSDSQVFGSGATTPYLWALNKVRDRQSNSMVFTYNSGTTLTLQSIKYTATPGTGAAAPYEVDFNYIARTGGTTVSKYVAGGAVSLANQLDNVNVLSSGTSVRKYLLSYSVSPTTQRPLLSSVQECGGSAGADCLHPTTLNYETGGAGWSTTATPTGLTGQYGLVPVDLNGDGIPDALYGRLSGTNTHWYAKIATPTGYGNEIDTGIITGYPIIPGNFAGKGGGQILAQNSGTWYVYTLNSAGTAFSSASTGLIANGEVSAVDYDGDGLPDLISYRGNSVYVLRNTTSGSTVSFGSAFLIWTDPTSIGFSGPSSNNSNISYADFNADGRGDLQVTTARNGPNGSSVYVYYVLLSNGFSAPATAVTLVPRDLGGNPAAFGDWNGDGCTDLYAANSIYISNCAGGFTQLTTTSDANSWYMLLDYDGDGQSDLIYSHAGMFYVQRSTGTGIAAAVSTGIPNPGSATCTPSFFPMDRNSDGQPDMAIIDSCNAYAVNYYPHNGVNTPPDLATSITDGFGINFSPSYVPISQNNYTKGTSANFPDNDFQGPMYVVNQFAASDGVGGAYTNQFWYYSAQVNLQGRGFEGFGATRKFEARNGLYDFQYFRQDFPYIGSVSEEDHYQANLTTLIGKTANNYSLTTLAGTGCSSRCFPYLSSTTTQKYEVGGSANGTLISTATTGYTYDTYGNVTQTNLNVTDNDTGSPFSGQIWNTVINNTISNDSSNWCIGRPSSSTTTQTAPGKAAITRRVDHTIDYSACRATAEIVEPSDARLKVITNFGFDACGNTNSVSVVGLDQNGTSLPARTTATSYGTRCQLPELVTNALSQTTTAGYDYGSGVKTSQTDPNGISVSWQYDSFARKKQENRPDGTSTTWAYADCPAGSCWGGVADLRFLVTETLLNSTGSTVRIRQKFYDGLDRLRFDESNRALGTWTDTESVYDSLGRKTDEYLPYTSSFVGSHHYAFDSINRVMADTRLDGGGHAYGVVTYGYAGRTTTVQDAMGYTTSRVSDVAGKLRRVVDPSPGGTTNYDYDSLGNLVSISDATNITSTYSYNVRGFKTASADADTGAWTFIPDSLNELVSQTDAKGQVTGFGYDLLGRLVTRTEPESTTPTTFTFGTSATAHNVGRLTGVSKPDGYAESYSFDSYGRPQTAIYTEDGVNYQFDYAYNTLGLVDTLTYPVSPTGGRFALKYAYDAWGFLSQTQDAGTGKAYWQLNAVNDSNLPTTETLGNGVQVTSGYRPWTNEITSRSEGTGSSTNNLQNLNYDWDLNGNLKQRQDLIQGLTETFQLDALNRLQTSNLNGVQNLSAGYDAAGNLQTKSDVGSYTYGDSHHPHAVTAAGSWTMAYDADGNATSRAGGAITWYSYNLPNQINYNGSSAQFLYNANHQRWKQIANYAGTTETVYYIGGLLEIMNRGTLTEYRHQIPAGTSAVILTVRSDCSTSTYYATSDHLGSSDLIMDGSSAVLSKTSFTPFGARRGSNWQGVPSSSDYNTFTSTTRRGFTGHEMLDAVSLVHMNGRVYDPFMGKFLAADNIIENPAATQSINPYSYAWNDPLKFTDPSGHSLFGDILGIFAAALIIAFAPEIGLPAITAAEGVTTAVVAGFVGGFVGAIVSTGSLSAALTAGIVGGLVGAAFFEAGSFAQSASNGGAGWRYAAGVVSHAAVGCFQGVASGGNCGRGAVAAAVAEAAGSQIKEAAEWGGAGAGIAAAGIVGGAASRAVGGSFSEGFSVGAAGYLFNQMAHALRAYGEGANTVIPRDDGTEEVRTGGSLSWRNNNPGNLRDTPFSEDDGAIGNAHGFAVFSSEDAGRTALTDLLQTNTYQNMTVGDAITRYAPPVENDTSNYTHLIENFTGLSAGTPMSSLTGLQIQSVVGAIQRIEGWTVGTVYTRQGQ